LRRRKRGEEERMSRRRRGGEEERKTDSTFSAMFLTRRLVPVLISSFVTD
jgi:hypothetical protein